MASRSFCSNERERRCFVVAIPILLLVAAVIAQADDPILVVNSGGHEGTIKALLFTPDGKYLISAGEDKVIRVWQVATGNLLRTIRGEIHDGQDGKIYAAALSRDGKLLAVAGYLNQGQGTYVRVLDFVTGDVRGIFVGHTDVVTGLSFSPDGRLLASASADKNVRLWDLTQPQVDGRILPGHTQPVNCVAFSPDGRRVVSGGHDRNVLVWDALSGKLLQTLSGHKDQIASVAYTPNGRHILSSAEDQTIRKWDTRTGRAIEPALGQQGGGAGSLLVWRDGSRFLTSSSYSADGESRSVAEIRRTDNGSVLTTFRAHQRTISASAISPDLTLAATAGGYRNEIRLWKTSNGDAVRTIVGAGSPVFGVGFARDGNSIAFTTKLRARPQPNAWSPEPERTMILRQGNVYEVREGPPATRAATTYLTALEQHADRQLRLSAAQTDPLGKLEIMRGSEVLAAITRDNRSGYGHYAYTFTNDGRQIISGGLGGILAAYDSQTGRLIKPLTGHTGDIWSVAVSPDSTMLVSGSDDQTIRVWDLRTYRNLLSIFIAEDGEWVAWTPQGYYMCRQNGDRYIGWHVNNGVKHQPDYFGAARFADKFYNPFIVSRFLETRNIEQAVATVNISARTPEPVRSPATIAELKPPTVVIGTPVEREEIRTTQAMLKVVARARSDTPIRKWKIFIGGRTVYEETPEKPTTDSFLARNIELSTGKNVITVVADNGREDTDSRIVTLEGPIRPPTTKPVLAVLAIGLSEYKQKQFRLNFGDKDALAIADLFKKQKSLFSDVKVMTLVNRDATGPGIVKGLRWLARNDTAGPDDIRVIFFAGHASKVEDRGYYFWTYDHDPDLSGAVDLNSMTLTDLIKEIDGNTVLIVDTCHAAGLPSDRGTSDYRNIRPDQMAQEFQMRTRKRGLTLASYAAAAATEKAREDASWGGGHGALTAAILAAFEPSGRFSAGNDDATAKFLKEYVKGLSSQKTRRISNEVLGKFVKQYVELLTKDGQRVDYRLEPPQSPHFDIYELP